MSTPFSCFSSIQELLRILRCRVVCFANSLFRRSFFPTFQVSPVFIPGTLDSSCRHVSGNVNVGGCFLGILELGFFPGLVGLCAFFPFYQFGITAWNRLSFPPSFCCCLLAVWQEAKKRLSLVRSSAGEDLVGIHLLQAALFLLYLYFHILDNIDFE